MPQIWVDPELVVEHNGVRVYKTYRNDNGNDSYHNMFTTDIHEGKAFGSSAESDPYRFDIRDLPSYDEKLDRVEILKAAIENRDIEAPGPEAEPIPD